MFIDCINTLLSCELLCSSIAVKTTIIKTYGKGRKLPGLTFYACIVISFCRSGIFSIAITMPILLIYSFAKGANRSQLLITICVFAIAISSLVLIKMDTVSEILNRISDLTFTTTGRSALYEESLICFLLRHYMWNDLQFNLSRYLHLILIFEVFL